MAARQSNAILLLAALLSAGCSKPQAAPTFKLKRNVTVFDSKQSISALAEEFQETAARFCTARGGAVEVPGYSLRKHIPFAQSASAFLESQRNYPLASGSARPARARDEPPGRPIPEEAAPTLEPDRPPGKQSRATSILAVTMGAAGI